MYKRCVTISGDRYLYFYSEEPQEGKAGEERCEPKQTEPRSELRWHPILRQWVINATHRQDRTYKPPAEFCPLCPTQPGAFPTEVPEPDYEIVVFQNRFPALSGTAPRLPGQAPEGSELYAVEPGQGECEVVLYSSQHDGVLWELGLPRIRSLIEVWIDRFEELGARPEVQYVLIFENRGDAVGVTLHHPHGQIYALPFIPPIPERELESAKAHHAAHGRCLFCDVMEEEKKDGRRVVFENDHFTAFVPFFARYPYEVHLMPKRHVETIAGLTAEERQAMAEGMQQVVWRYDSLWNKPMSYMMIMHQAPTDGGAHPYTHFHVEFYPLNRTETKLKHLAGCESGAGTFVTDMAPEEQAEHLQNVKLKEARK